MVAGSLACLLEEHLEKAQRPKAQPSADIL